LFANLPQLLQSGPKVRSRGNLQPQSALLACSIASAFRGPALVDVRRLFYIAAALGAWPFRSTNVPSSSSTQRSAFELYAALRLPLANGRA
jgi:hypothetical protein